MSGTELLGLKSAEPVATPAPAEPAPSYSGRPIAEHLAALTCSLLVGVLALILFTRNNDFPPSYHIDEPGKARQLMDGEFRNFNHPLLMLEAAEQAVNIIKPPMHDRSIIIAGRYASAAMAAVGVVAITFAGFVLYGWIGLAIIGSVMALCPSLQIYAHYLKEDATLVGSILVTIAAAGLVIVTRAWWTRTLALLMLGVGCGLTVSSKYAGVMIFAPAIIAMLLAPGWRWWSLPARLLPFVIGALVTVGAVNHRAFDDVWRLKLHPEALNGIQRETEHGTTDHNSMALGTPNAYFVRIANSELMWHLKILGGAGLLWLLARGKFSRWGIAATIFLATFVIVLAHCPIPFGRYALPITVTAYLCCAAATAGALLTIRHRWWRLGAVAGVLLCIWLMQGSTALKITRMFRNDSRQQLREWIAANVPTNARVVADRYAQLHNPGDPWRFPAQANPMMPVYQASSVADFGSLDQVRRQFDYLVVCKMTWERYMLAGFHGVDGNEHTVNQRRKFYEDLLNSKMTPIWHYTPDPVTNSNLSPEIRVYKLK